VAHVGFVVDGQPYVIPTLFGRCENTLYLHGSAASRMLRHLETGAPTCVTVTQVDGLVLARSAFHHSMNYRSVVAFGSSRLIRDEKQKAEALRIISEHLIRGRWDEVRIPNSRELSLTSVIEFTIEEAGAKLRTGPPLDDVEDCQLPVWAGVIPLALTCGDPIPDPQTRPDQKIAMSVAEYRRRLPQQRNVTATNTGTMPFQPTEILELEPTTSRRQEERLSSTHPLESACRVRYD
jgi:uncharacterized protein